MSIHSFTRKKSLIKEDEKNRNVNNDKMNESNFLKSLPKEEKGKEVFLRKYCIIGAPYVGKTSIIQKFVYNKAPDNNNNSLIDEVHFKSFTYDNQIYDCKFADTKGYKSDTFISYNYPYRCDGFFLVYSIDNRESFELIPELYKKILIKFTDKNVPVIVVGNKSDLSNTNRVVSRNEGAIMAKQFNKSPFLECSALDDVSVTTIFEVMIYHDNTIRNLCSLQENKNNQCKIF